MRKSNMKRYGMKKYSMKKYSMKGYCAKGRNIGKNWARKLAAAMTAAVLAQSVFPIGALADEWIIAEEQVESPVIEEVQEWSAEQAGADDHARNPPEPLIVDEEPEIGGSGTQNGAIHGEEFGEVGTSRGEMLGEIGREISNGIGSEIGDEAGRGSGGIVRDKEAIQIWDTAADSQDGLAALRLEQPDTWTGLARENECELPLLVSNRSTLETLTGGSLKLVQPEGLAFKEASVRDKAVSISGGWLLLPDLHPGETIRLLVKLRTGKLDAQVRTLQIGAQLVYRIREDMEGESNAILVVPVQPERRGEGDSKGSGIPGEGDGTRPGSGGTGDSGTGESESGRPGEGESENPGTGGGDSTGSEDPEKGDGTQPSPGETGEIGNKGAGENGNKDVGQNGESDKPTEPASEQPNNPGSGGKRGKERRPKKDTDDGNTGGGSGGDGWAGGDGGADYVGSGSVGGETKKAEPMTPRILISRYDYDENARAGEAFPVTMTICNTSSAQKVENMVITIETGEGTSLENGTNTAYLPELGPSGTYELQTMLKVEEDGKTENADLGLSFKYEYMKGDERTEMDSSQKVSVPVKLPSRFETGELRSDDSPTEAEEFSVTLPFVNKGKVPVYNVEARIQTAMKTDETYKYIGNVNPGTNGTADFFVNPQEAGEQDVHLTLTYEDAAGNVTTVERDAAFEVAKPEQGEDMDMDELFAQFSDEMDDEGSRRMIPVIPLTAGGGAVGVTAVLFRRRHRKKKEIDEDEDF